MQKKSYKFAFQVSLIIALFILLIMFVLHFFDNNISYKIVFSVTFFTFVFSLFFIQNRLEKLVFYRLNKLFEEVKILDKTSLKDQTITTNIAALSKNIIDFAKKKKIEIEALKVQEEYRREFMGNVSHELKTPLFTIQGYLDTLIDGGAIKNEELGKKYIERAQIGVERLINIVEDLDMIAKLESDKKILDIESFDIIKQIQKIFDMLEIKADEKNIILMFDEKYSPILVKADKEQISQVLINLLDNSIKYGKQNGTSEVSIEKFKDNKILIRISDNGIGINNSEIHRVFERFYRIDKTGNRAAGGSGLGLSIVKHIIEAHNEKIFVQSSLGNGSEFSFTLKRSNN